MSKTPQERYDEIQKEIWQISESYTLITKDKTIDDLLSDEQRHMQFLQMRLNDLIKELNEMNAKQEIVIPLLYKDAVNKLRRSLLNNCPNEFIKVANDIDYLNVCLN